MSRFILSVLVAAVVISSTPAAEARPAGCPSLWCGCYMAIKHGYGVARGKALGMWKARNWAVLFNRVPIAPGTVAVFARGRGGGGHVGDVLQVDHARNMVLLHSGNDGRTVRTRWRPMRGLIAAVDPRSPRAAVTAAPQRAARAVRTARSKATRHHRVARHQGQRAPAAVPIRVAQHAPA